jgi:hypothetical protein
MFSFKATIEIIDVNPYVYLPEAVLTDIFDQAQKNKSPIPVRGTIDGHQFIQTLVKFRNAWRLYINAPMLKSTKKSVGDQVTLSIEYDPVERSQAIHPGLMAALNKNIKAKTAFDHLAPSRKKEIIRYINHLKTEASISKNILRAIRFLEGKERFVGRDKP